MKKKITREFCFRYPLAQKVVRNFRIVTEKVGELVIEGTAYYNTTASVFDADTPRYEVDIDFIKWNGTDIRPVVELSGMMDDITDAAVRYASTLFTQGTVNDLAA